MAMSTLSRPLGVDLEQVEGVAGPPPRLILPAAPDLGEVPAPGRRQPVGDAGRPPGRGRRSSLPASGLDPDVEDGCGAADDRRQLGRLVEVEGGPVKPKRSRSGGGEHAGCGVVAPTEREAGDLDPDRPGGGPLADDDVEAEVLHRPGTGISSTVRASRWISSMKSTFAVPGGLVRMAARSPGPAPATGPDVTLKPTPSSEATMWGERRPSRGRGWPAKSRLGRRVSSRALAAVEDDREVLLGGGLPDEVVEACGAEATGRAPSPRRHAPRARRPGRGYGRRSCLGRLPAGELLQGRPAPWSSTEGARARPRFRGCPATPTAYSRDPVSAARASASAEPGNR